MWNFQREIPLTPKAALQAERNTIASSCCTAMGDVPFTDAAIIILYANLLGASDTFTMITTSILPLITGFLAIPMAGMTMRGKSYQQTILLATSLSLVMFGVIVGAPFFGSYSVFVLLTALCLFAVCHTTYISAWFPLLDTFLYQERRSSYLGRMRFSWQLSSALLLFAVGTIIGKNPPIGVLQLVMLFSMFIFAFKLYFIAAVPRFTAPAGENFNFRAGLEKTLANKPLAGYSVYLFILNLAAYGTIPLMTLYLKKALGAPDNIIVFISSLTLGGMLVGSFCAGPIIRRFGIRDTFLGVHVVYALSNLGLFFMGRGLMPDLWLYATIGGILFIYSFTFACANISSSSEMMALATPGNKVMAMAFCNSFYYAGSGISRLLTSLILGSGALAEYWTLGGTNFCHYQTLFLIYTVCIVFAASLLVVVPAVFPKGEYIYAIHK